MGLVTSSVGRVRAAAAILAVLWFSPQTVGAQTVEATGFGPTATPAGSMPADYDGDGRTDVGIWRASSGQWIINGSSGSLFVNSTFGVPAAGDIPVPADWDGDGRADLAVYRYPTGQWILFQSTLGARTVSWGTPEFGDVPIQADYDGDGRADFGVYRTATGQYYVALSGGGVIGATWGDPALDVPVVGDFDGDGKADFTVYRGSTGEWRSLLSNGGTAQVHWGSAGFGDVPVAADYDGDGRTDPAIYRSTTGEWFVQTAVGAWSRPWGAPSLGDMPVPGDYDGDGKADVAIYRTASGGWLISRSSNGSVDSATWGAASLRDLARIELRPIFTLTGVVADASNGAPLAGAQVSVLTGPHAGATVTTDALGRYAIGGLTRGTITVRATRSGYVASDRSVGVFGNARQDFPLAAVPVIVTFGPGQYLVGSSIAAGRYFSSPSYGCYWERQSGLGGTFGEIIANEFVDFNAGQWVVDILPSDRAFSTDNECGTWSNAPRPAPAAGSITPGVWLNNSQIVPGLYRATALPGCYWERRRDFKGMLSSIIANNFISGGGTVFVQISASDAGFLSDADCGTWTRIASVNDQAAPDSGSNVAGEAEQSASEIEQNRDRNRLDDPRR